MNKMKGTSKLRWKALAAAVVGFFCQSHPASGQVGFGPGETMDVKAALHQAAADGQEGKAVSGLTATAQAFAPVEWIEIPGDTFMMGSKPDGIFWDTHDAVPVHSVTVKTFLLSKTLVTVEQYAECVAQHRCSEPDRGWGCNWGVAGRERHPLNCVDWEQANQYTRFKNARLPTESEWECAARAGAEQRTYPWGEEPATCRRAVMDKCGHSGTRPVCSTPEGNSKHGLCDMAGNLWQWVQDKYVSSYEHAPTDGSALTARGYDRVVRGGSWVNGPRQLRAFYRGNDEDDHRDRNLGFRIAR